MTAMNPCVAHRGASGLAPENTMAAFRKAMAFPFVEWIELDVQLSKDGIPVVIHDDTLRRTAGRRSKVSRVDADTLGRMDAGRWFSPAYKGEPVPRLEDVIEATKGRVSLNVELKTYGGRYPGMERRVVDLLYKHGVQSSTVITSFDAFALRRVRRLSDEIAIGLISDSAPPALIEDLRWLEARFLSISHSQLTPERAAEFREAGLKVMAWTVNDPDRMRRLAAMDPGILICTNYPDRYADALLPQSSVNP